VTLRSRLEKLEAASGGSGGIKDLSDEELMARARVLTRRLLDQCLGAGNPPGPVLESGLRLCPELKKGLSARELQVLGLL
jgi:hypothetical protein